MSKELEALKELKDIEVLFKSRNTIYMGGEKTETFNHKNTIGNEFKGIFEIIEKSLKALEILKRNVKVSIDYGEEGKDISMALVVYIDNKKTIYVVDEAIKEKNPEHFKELELLKEVLE